MKIDQAYRYIKRQIIDGVWVPDTAINVNEVSEHLNISRTPIHKAMTKLAEEGFLSVIPQVGVFVKRPDMEEVMERLLVCTNLDALMTEYAVKNLNDDELSQMYTILTKMDNLEISEEEYSSLNIEFHTIIYKAAKLPYTFTLANQLWDYLNYVGNPALLFSLDRRKQSQAEHWMIYYSLKERDAKLAKKLMEKHLTRIAESVSEKYQKMGIAQEVVNEV
ncbi:GntR family transcriptional regulator [Neobacillus sp. DY30]|uniref:GntR family transcriptional regulator n=1 Tax=Neobacillus sp. DY30 TaxID=3047871 RepID=UPI0024C09796|nr:GntR family transcriptional regulator [Neobacillus sp. DY30]WHY02424.1 GntR family transcriptional regulator [Neobacillus sp. DY30]